MVASAFAKTVHDEVLKCITTNFHYSEGENSEKAKIAKVYNFLKNFPPSSNNPLRDPYPLSIK